MFSSTSAVLGNVGQCDYAYANAFMDYFATIREGLRSEKKRFGKTLAINWPLWEAGGMKVAEETLEWIQAKTGLYPLATMKGIKAFETALQVNVPQVIVMEGRSAQIKSTVQEKIDLHGRFLKKGPKYLSTVGMTRFERLRYSAQFANGWIFYGVYRTRFAKRASVFLKKVMKIK